MDCSCKCARHEHSVSAAYTPGSAQLSQQVSTPHFTVLASPPSPCTCAMGASSLIPPSLHVLLKITQSVVSSESCCNYLSPGGSRGRKGGKAKSEPWESARLSIPLLPVHRRLEFLVYLGILLLSQRLNTKDLNNN